MYEDINVQTVRIFLNWVKDGGLAQWIEAYMNDPKKLEEINEVYKKIKSIFGV